MRTQVTTGVMVAVAVAAASREPFGRAMRIGSRGHGIGLGDSETGAYVVFDDGLRPEQPPFTDYAALIRLEVERAVAAAEVQLRSERQVGLLLREAPLDRGGRPPANRLKDTTGFVGLPECGLTKDLSARCRRLAAIEEETFEGYLATSRSSLRAATVAGALRAARAASGTPPTPEGACTRAVQRFGRLLAQARRLALDFGLEEQVAALKAADRLQRGLDTTFAPDAPARINNTKGVTR